MSEEIAANDEVAIAYVGRYRGNRGEVFLNPLFDLRKENLENKDVELRWPEGRKQIAHIERIWWHGKKTVCHFLGSKTIGDAQNLRGAEVIVKRDLLKPLDPDEYFMADLIGCEAQTTGGRRLGIVQEVRDSAGSVILVLGGDHEYLIPLAKSIVVNIDLDNKCLTIDPPKGLLEINED